MSIITDGNRPSSGGGGGGSNVNLTNITGGPLATTKGGTSINAHDLDSLKHSLGIAAELTEGPMIYCGNADTQKNDTIQRVDSSTESGPTGLADGILIRTGNDQIAINLADGKRWIRTLTDSNAGAWAALPDPTMTGRNNAGDLKEMANGDVGVITLHQDAAFRPSFTDGSHPPKVIIARTDMVRAPNTHSHQSIQFLVGKSDHQGR